MRNRRPALLRGTIGGAPLAASFGFFLAGIAVTASSIIGLVLGDDLDVGHASTILVGLAAMAAGGITARLPLPDRISRPMAMAMFVIGWLALASTAWIAMLLSAEYDGALNAMFESVSAATTTGFTTIEDPQTLSVTGRLLRVTIPWCAGLGVLIVGMGVLPAAVAGAELLPMRQLRGGKQLVTTQTEALRNIVGLYFLLTLVLTAGYLVAGLGPFDAASYAFSTASTGGMSNHAESLGAFDGALVPLVASAGMVAAGANLFVVWWALRGQFEAVWRSSELRLYLNVIAFGVIAVFIMGDLSLSESTFAVTSMLSTTGLRSANWAADISFVHAVLFVAAGIGAMSGSVGSGFRLARVARVALEVGRGLRGLLNPHVVAVVRLDGVAVDEASLNRTYGYLWMHAFALGGVALLLNANGVDITGTLSASLALVSNLGIFVNGSELVAVVDWSPWSRAVAMVAMVLGRLSIYPVLVFIAGVVRTAERIRPHREAGVRG